MSRGSGTSARRRRWLPQALCTPEIDAGPNAARVAVNAKGEALPAFPRGRTAPLQSTRRAANFNPSISALKCGCRLRGL
jgi:hypothetical protein